MTRSLTCLLLISILGFPFNLGPLNARAAAFDSHVLAKETPDPREVIIHCKFSGCFDRYSQDLLKESMRKLLNDASKPKKYVNRGPSSKTIIENCRNFDCSKKYSQEVLQRNMGRSVNNAFDLAYFGSNKSKQGDYGGYSKRRIKDALTILPSLRTCDPQECNDENSIWTSDQIKQAERLLECLIGIDNYELVARISELSDYYNKSSDGRSEWVLAEIETLRQNKQSSYNEEQLLFLGDFQKPNGSYAFLKASAFAPCAYLNTSEQTLSNLRKIMPKRLASGVF